MKQISFRKIGIGSFGQAKACPTEIGELSGACFSLPKRAKILPLATAALALMLGGCMVGPKYKTPTAPVPSAFKEAPPASFKEGDGRSEEHTSELQSLRHLVC